MASFFFLCFSVPASRGEYERILQQLENEKFGKPPKPFHSLDREQRAHIEKKRVVGNLLFGLKSLFFEEVEEVKESLLVKNPCLKFLRFFGNRCCFT